MLISDIENKLSLGKRLLLFQSKGQAISYIISTLVGIFLFAAIFSTNIDKLFSSLPLVLCSFAGSSVVLFMTFPAMFFISLGKDVDKNKILKSVIEILRRHGYCCFDGGSIDRGVLLRPTLPWFLRWEENTITVLEKDGRFEISGPVFMMRILRNSCLRRLAQEEKSN